MNSSGRSCSLCRYQEPRLDDNGAFMDNRCHRFPPTPMGVIPLSLVSEVGPFNEFSRYPKVGKDDWCLEYNEIFGLGLGSISCM